MDFELDDEQIALVDSVRSVLARELGSYEQRGVLLHHVAATTCTGEETT